MAISTDYRASVGDERRARAHRDFGPAEPPQSRLLAVLNRSPKPVMLVLDMATATLALWLASVLITHARGDAIGTLRSIVFVLLSLGLHLACFAHYRLYSARFITRGVDELRRVVNGTAVAHIGVAATAFAIKIQLSRAWVLMSFALVVLFVGLERFAIRRCFRRLRRQGYLVRRVVLVGDNPEGHALADMFLGDACLGYHVVDVIDDVVRHPSPGEDPISDLLECTMQAVAFHDACGVVIAPTALDLNGTNRLVRGLTDEGIHVELSSSLCDIATRRLTLRPLGRFPVMYIEPVQRHGWRPLAKRAFDICFALWGLLLTSPIVLLAAVAVKVDSPGPVFFRQSRVGRNGKPFRLLKLRTMTADAEVRLADVLQFNEREGPFFKIANDPRITRVGRLLRRLSIDELPQFVNVLRNEMSVVGPRPALPREVSQWDSDFNQRLRVKPGITGMWQVHGRGSASFESYQQLDLFYVDNWSLVTDLGIVMRTVPAVLSGRGAH